MPDVRGRGVGDLNVHIHVEVPKKLSQRAEELLRELAEEEQADVSPKRSSFLTRLAEYFTPENAETTPDDQAANNT
jgi:molecular chaperone DnaJ